MNEIDLSDRQRQACVQSVLQAGDDEEGTGGGEPGGVQLLAQAGGPRALAFNTEEAPSRAAGPPVGWAAHVCGGAGRSPPVAAAFTEAAPSEFAGCKKGFGVPLCK